MIDVQQVNLSGLFCKLMCSKTSSFFSTLFQMDWLLFLARACTCLKKKGNDSLIISFSLYLISSSRSCSSLLLCLFFLSMTASFESCINFKLSKILFLSTTTFLFFYCFFFPINFIIIIYTPIITNQHLKQMSSINVYVRMRPHLLHQRDQRTEKKRIMMDEQSQLVKVELTEQRQKIFKFNKIFGPQTSQHQIYDGVQAISLVDRVVQGYHSTIFAYGQTGSGKTFTIEGGDSSQIQGIIPRAIRELFSKIDQKSSSDKGFKVFISFIQIYNESIFDLIDSNQGKALKMRWNKLQQFTVQNMFEGQCRSAEEALRWWRKGQKNKIIGSHKMNNSSSRSHCLLTLRVQSFLLEDPSEQIESKLEIVDLAGSERQKVTKSTGVVFRQGIEINKSLFTLRQVISSLYETSTTGKTTIMPPYRDSKLTSLLKQSIGGNSYCVMIACLNPTMAHFEQSVQTLTYASMASYISNVPTKNVDPKIQQNHQLREQNIQLQSQLRKLEEHIQYLTKLLETNECASCKNKAAVKKTETDFSSMRNMSELEDNDEPKGLLELSKNKTRQYIRQKSLNYINLNDLNQIPEKTYEHLLTRTTGGGRTLKSTKEIIESIAMIRDLISANSTLREKIEGLKNHIEKQEKQTFALMKENQVLRDRWDMISVNIKPESQIVGEEAPIAMLERMMKEQRGEGLRANSYNSQSIKVQSEGHLSKMSYNDFLKGRKGKLQKQKRETLRRKNRIYSQSKRLDSFLM